MKVLKWIDLHLEETLMVVLLFIISFDTCLQVVCRYVLNASLSWPEELSRYSFVFSGFFSLGFCVRRMNMLKIDIVLQYMPEKVKQYMVHFSMVLFTVIMAYVFSGAWKLWTDSFSGASRTSALQIPNYVIYAVPVIGIALCLVRCVQYFVLVFLRKGGES